MGREALSRAGGWTKADQGARDAAFLGRHPGRGVGRVADVLSPGRGGHIRRHAACRWKDRGRSGSFVLETSGSFDGTTARATWSIILGSGTNGLSGLRGSGTYVAGHGSTAEITLECELA